MNKYLLVTEGKQIDGSLTDLRAFVKNIQSPYEIYLVKESKANGKELQAIPTVFHKTFTDDDIENIFRLLNKGYSKRIIAKKMHVSLYVIQEIVKSHAYQNK